MINIALTSEGAARLYSKERFETLLGVRYLPHLTFNDWQAERWIRLKCREAHKKGSISSLALWLGAWHHQDIQKAPIPDVTIRWRGPAIGYGIFTNRALKKWEFIGEYTGVVRRRNLFFRNINDYCFMYPREWISFKMFTIDSEKEGNFTRFINHSDTPNCESVAVFYEGIFHIIFRTIQDVPEGAELTYNYGDMYWLRRKKLS